MLNPAVKLQVDDLAAKFATGVPCRHVCIDRFFADDVAEKILGDFPVFSATNRTNEFGLEGYKAVHERLSDVSPFYAKLVEYLKSDEFHVFLERVTGIAGLRWGGESMYGGGTHENVRDSELDPHVDFNYDDRTKEHRRLNLLIYLTKDWQSEWGGEFELHSEPRNPGVNIVKRYALLFNRAILMETNERSWHGFPRIQLPEDKRNLSRKSIALYFYTKDRPVAEVTGGHGTFYVHRPLPENFKAGAVVTDAMEAEIKGITIKRDAFLELYQTREIEMSKRFSEIEAYLNFTIERFRVPIIGNALQHGAVRGYYPDDWMTNSFHGVFQVVRPLSQVVARFYIPEHASFPMEMTLTVNGVSVSKTFTEAALCELSVAVNLRATSECHVSLSSTSTTSGKRAGLNEDAREVSAMLTCLAFL